MSEFSPYPEVIHGSATFKLTKGYQRIKKSHQIINFMSLFFDFLHSRVPDNKYQKRSSVCYFSHASN